MKSGLLPKIFAYAGSISIERTWRASGENVNRQVKMRDISNINKIYAKKYINNSMAATMDGAFG